MKMDQFQHPDSIWTWKSNARGAKASLWLPYFDGVKKIAGSRWCLGFNGGDVEVDLKQVDTIMAYGATGSVPVAFLDALGTHRVPMLIHRRNMDAPTLVLPPPRPDGSDLMGRQIVARMNLTRAAYVARTLVQARFQAVDDLVPIPSIGWRRLKQVRSIERVRLIEAEWSQRYWKNYFAAVGRPESRRRQQCTLSAALDAGSFFLYGVILRWVLVHRLSPHHGFLHRPTDYASLVYDLMEPFRYLFERAAASAARAGNEGKQLTGATLSNLKRLMEETVYVPATRQYVRRKNLVHGGVLALRAWLAGEMPRLVFPSEGAPRGGRPLKVSYALPGGRRHTAHEKPPKPF